MSTTMLDSYDAQMLDYHSHDLDVHMNSLIGSEQWTHDEAVMEDDGLHPTHKAMFENISIEVDMEDYDASTTEYDMLNDTHHTSEENPHDVDVEVYDASQVHSPAVVSQPVPDDTHTALSYAPIMPQSIEDNVFSTAVAEAPPEDHESTTPTPCIEGSQLAAEEQGDGISATDQVDVTVVVKVNAEDKESTEVDTSIDPLTNSSSENPPQGSDDLYLNQSREGAKISDGQARESNVESERLDSSVADTEKHDVVLDENSSQAIAAYDPHEILEGVYIDPPPSVLLMIDIADQYEVSLFNDATVPPDREGKQDSASSVVLLQNRPTLYYESLSSVFEAFRQETFLFDMPDISEGELVLEAFDLQLVMPEDNCYAREISLHDINMLHDGCALTGPLRLKLRLDLPRFIIRYQRLQERAAQLTVENQEVESSQVILPTTQDESGHVCTYSAEELRHDVRSGDVKIEASGIQHEEKQDNVTATELQQETIVQRDGHGSELTEDNYGLEYVDNAETDTGNVPSEPKVMGSSDESGEYSSDLRQAPAKVVGETSNIEDNDKGEIASSISRPVSPHVSGDAVFASTASVEKERTEDTGTSNIAENHDLDEPLSEQSSLNSNYEAEDAHHSTLTHDIYHHSVSSEEQSATLTTESGGAEEAAAEQWDDEYYEEGEVDASWDYEANQEEQEEEQEEEQDSASIESSVTLSSRLSSKRSFHELDENEDETLTQSPGPKKLRTE